MSAPTPPPSPAWLGAFRTLRALSRADWALLVSAVVMVSVVTTAVRLLGLRRVLAVVERLTAGRPRQPDADTRGAARAAWLLEAAARCCWPRPTCLAKALVMLAVLRWRGQPAELVLGVTKRRGLFESHAWVRLGQRVVLGDPVGVDYAALASLHGPAS